GLAGSDLAGQHEEPGIPPHAVHELSEGLAMPRREVEELRIGRRAEWLFFEAVKGQIHRNLRVRIRRVTRYRPTDRSRAPGSTTPPRRTPYRAQSRPWPVDCDAPAGLSRRRWRRAGCSPARAPW